MPFDFQYDASEIRKPDQLAFSFSAPAKRPPPAKMDIAGTNYHAGLNAERMVCRRYLRAGARFLKHRWRGPGGEIDLILTEGDRVVFVEVKKSKTHGAALERVSRRQIARICASAEAYLETCENGSLTEMRIDVASVDACGSVEILRNVGIAA